MASANVTRWHHADAVPLEAIPSLGIDDFRQSVCEEVSGGGKLVALFGRPVADRVQLIAVLAYHTTSTITAFTTEVQDRYPALTPDCPQAHWFEREIAEQWGVVPEHH